VQTFWLVLRLAAGSWPHFGVILLKVQALIFNKISGYFFEK
jgi:hypothetical protein